MPNTRRWIWVDLAALALALAVAGAPAASASEASYSHAAAADSSLESDPSPAQSTWFDYHKDLTDPTLTYTQDIRCDQFTPAGQDTLYPYIVAETPVHSLAPQYAYRSNSSKGVLITPNNAATDDLNYTGLALTVTSLHVTGNYAIKISLECQSNATYPAATVSQATLQGADSTSASVSVAISDKVELDSTVRYYVQYGTKYASYTDKTPTVSEDFRGKADITRTIQIPHLQPGTTYHYRVAVVVQEGSDIFQTSYSGADQTFTTTTPAPMTLNASTTHVTLGQAPVLTVQMPANATGLVGFYDFAQPGANKGIGTAPIVNGIATLTTPTRPLVLGDNPIQASYGGDANWAANDSNFVTVTVGPKAGRLVTGQAHEAHAR